ncbi:hypothetical protein HYQ44_020365 [Verticillium longisporum]|nr:hypothetical protein HYQ44_020365 [Verticillium longisporum]
MGEGARRTYTPLSLYEENEAKKAFERANRMADEANRMVDEDNEDGNRSSSTHEPSDTINESKWANLNDGGDGAEGAVRPSDATSESARAARSATETPVVPGESSVELDKKGFASKEEGGALAN